jgi:N-acyl homoserine lactone hydrolase
LGTLGDPSLAPFGVGRDLFGDGSLVLLPTPEHTPGSSSLFVRRPHHVPLLMVGDLTYNDDLLQDGKLRGVGAKRVMSAYAAHANKLRAALPGLVVLPERDLGARCHETSPRTRTGTTPDAEPFGTRNITPERAL